MNSLADYTPRIWKDDPQQKEKGKCIFHTIVCIVNHVSIQAMWPRWNISCQEE